MKIKKSTPHLGLSIRRNLRMLLSVMLLFGCSNNDDIMEVPDPEVKTDVRLKSYTYDGSEYKIMYKGDNRVKNFEANNGAGGVITISPQYNSSNQIIELYGRQYQYDSQGRVNKVFYSNTNYDRIAVIAYNNKNQIAKVKVSEGNSWADTMELEYDDNNNLVKLTEIYTEYLVSDPQDRTYTQLITYDENGNPTKVVSHLYLVATNETIDWELKNTYDDKLTPEYNFLTHLGSQNHISVFDTPFGNKIYLGSGYQENIRLYYYLNHNIVKQESSSSFGSWYQSTITYLYNDEGYPLSSESTLLSSNNQSNGTGFSGWTYEPELN